MRTAGPLRFRARFLVMTRFHAAPRKIQRPHVTPLAACPEARYRLAHREVAWRCLVCQLPWQVSLPLSPEDPPHASISCRLGRRRSSWHFRSFRPSSAASFLVREQRDGLAQPIS